ncbi:MAG TPA: tetratricopeptide repeat protein [Planctomycetaceae bacterium]|mgnify:CR=1 FL=1|nr:tetratricopeptide repeat protein [Planctomycetaceae bacterium]
MNVLASKSQNRQRVLNPRVAVIVAIVLTVLVYGTRKLHDRQFGKTVDFLRQSAYASLEAKDYRKAHGQFSQYLAFRPKDLDAREKLSSLLSTRIRTRPALEQAFLLNEELLRNELPQVELRLEQARIAVQLGKFSDAESHLRLLQFSREANGEIWYLSGHCANEQRKTDDAARCYQRAIGCPSPPEKAFDELATLADGNPQLSLDSWDILDQMVTKCQSAEAYRLRAMRFVENREPAAALRDVWKGLAKSPDDIALNTMLGYCLQQDDAADTQRGTIDDSKEVSQAILHLQRCVERNPGTNSFRVNLSALLWKTHQESAAIAVLESGIGRNARAFELQSVLIEYLLSQKKIDKAERLLSDLPTTALPKAERELITGRIELIRKNWKSADRSMQKAIAYSEPGSSLQQRAQMLLAMCRSNSGNSTTAVDAFRAVLTANPNSVPGQLGMASAWIKSGRTDLAIAEYRHLLDVPGVPAYLAELLIQRNLQQPTGQRDWSEVASLVRDENPYIVSPSQRTLLQADLMMASGRITQAIVHLESAHAENPEDAAVDRALARLNGEQSGRLRERLQQLAIDYPANHEVLAALIRLEIGANHADAASKMLEDIATNPRGSKLTQIESLTLAIRTAETVTALETQRGRTSHAEIFRDATRRFASQLVKLEPLHHATLVRILAEQGRTKEALSHVRSISDPSNLAVKASVLMALAAYASPRSSVLPEVTKDLFAMITVAPDNTALRICYADSLLYGDYPETATQVLEQIQNSPPDNGDVSARLAWILAVNSDDAKKARELISHALHMQPQNPAFRIIESRVLLSAGQFQEALETLSSIDDQHQSRAAITYKAQALLELGEMGEAWHVVEQIHRQQLHDPMFPADERLLETIKNRLNQFTTASRSQP